MLNENIKTFVVSVSSLNLGSKITIYLAKKIQIIFLLVKKVGVLAKYLNFTNVFFEELAKALPK